MATKKQRQPKAPKLKLVNRSPVGLTEAQQKELSDLYRPLMRLGDWSAALGDKEKMLRLAMDRYLYLYIATLCYDASLDTMTVRRRRETATRRQIFKEMGKLCQREFSPDDLVKELSRTAPVPAYAVDAIRRDYLRLTVH
jgi:hypothetical protein